MLDQVKKNPGGKIGRPLWNHSPVKIRAVPTVVKEEWDLQSLIIYAESPAPHLSVELSQSVINVPQVDYETIRNRRQQTLVMLRSKLCRCLCYSIRPADEQ